MRNSSLIISAAMAVSALFGLGAASAADLPAQTYTKAAPVMVAPVPSWTGCFIGGGGGYVYFAVFDQTKRDGSLLSADSFDNNQQRRGKIRL